LSGEDGVVLFGTGTGTVIEITAPGCEIRGLTIDGTGNGASNDMDAAIRITSSGNRIVGNRIRRAFYGIVVAGAAGNLIEGNDIAGLADEPFGRRGDGIYLYRAPNNQIRRNTVSGMRDAIYFQYAPGGIAVGNVVRGSRYGLHDMFSDNTRIAATCSAGVQPGRA
jgi:nitrous oxidase accessory protein